MIYVNKKQIKKDYIAGLKYKEIQEKHNITKNQLIYLIQKNNWKRERNRSNTLKDNTNAKGNKGGHAPKKNKNAVTTGEYETLYKDILSDEEISILNNFKIENEKKLLTEEYAMLIIRERRMLERIKKLQKSESSVSLNYVEECQSSGISKEKVFKYEAKNNAIQRIEEGLTRVQDAKRKCIETINKLVINKDDDEYDENNSFIDALNIKSEEIWNEEE